MYVFCLKLISHFSTFAAQIHQPTVIAMETPIIRLDNIKYVSALLLFGWQGIQPTKSYLNNFQKLYIGEPGSPA